MYHHQDPNQIVFTTITVSVSRQEEEERLFDFVGHDWCTYPGLSNPRGHERVLKVEMRNEKRQTMTGAASEEGKGSTAGEDKIVACPSRIATTATTKQFIHQISTQSQQQQH